MQTKPRYLMNSHPLPCVDCGEIAPAGAARIWRAKGGVWIGAHADKSECAIVTPINVTEIPPCDNIDDFLAAIDSAISPDIIPDIDHADPLGIGY